MKLKVGAYLEERANKDVFLVLEKKEMLLEGIADKVVSKLYFSDVDAAVLERMLPGALKELENLSDWVE